MPIENSLDRFEEALKAAMLCDEGNTQVENQAYRQDAIDLAAKCLQDIADIRVELEGMCGYLDRSRIEEIGSGSIYHKILRSITATKNKGE